MIDALARIWVLPIWSGPVHPKPLKGGLSNQSYIVEDQGNAYVVRFGRDYPFHHVFRARELMTAKAAYAADFGPEVIYHGPGVMVSRYIEGKTLEAADVRANIPRIAAIMRRFHDEMPRHVSGPGFMFWPFHVIRDYARTLAAGGSRLSSEIPRYMDLSARLEALQPPMPIVFGHNDFLPSNMIEGEDRIWLIDFEYSGFTTPIFDLANVASNSSFSDAEAEELMALYGGARPDPAEMRALAAMQCASLLREAMWGLVSELHLTNVGIDYAAYAQSNLDRMNEAIEAYQTRFGTL